jgi:hypothetical protein
MKLNELVRFKRELFFEGAAQLSWFDEDKKRSNEAATSFIFHGPKYHGFNKEENKQDLKDTLSFLRDILKGLTKEENPNFSNLAIAGYGMGKSHLALAIGVLLSEYPSETSKKIINNIPQEDQEITKEIESYLKNFKKPMLVVALDGMRNFDLGTELYRKSVNQLKLHNLDLTPIYDLSPRFKIAENFVSRNFELRKDLFTKIFDNSITQDSIIQKINEHDEDYYEKIDKVYFEANGVNIAIEGSESTQNLIDTICSVYCGNDEIKPFSKLIILFDEFGRFLEYAADKPHLAGDANLQQIFEGIQNNQSSSCFLGFIQYEIKTYFQRIKLSAVSTLQRYIGRYDSSAKFYLSSNLETIFANLIEKKDIASINEITINRTLLNKWQYLHNKMLEKLPDFKLSNFWSNKENFYNVIVNGCWPLHPISVWFLAQQKDIVQNRSAMTFIEEQLNFFSEKEVTKEQPFYIYASEFCMGGILQEIIKSEETQQGSIANRFVGIREKNKDRLSESQLNVLSSIVVAHKIKVQSDSESEMQEFLTFISGLEINELKESINELSNDFNVLEWNKELTRYEFLVDSVTRGNFNEFIKSRIKLKLTKKDIVEDLFQNSIKNIASDPEYLGDIETDFAHKKSISSTDFQFESSCITKKTREIGIKTAINNFLKARSHDEKKGQLLYYFVPQSENISKETEDFKELFHKEIKSRGLEVIPVFACILYDQDGEIGLNLIKNNVLENLNEEETNKYRNFLTSEKEKSSKLLISKINTSLSNKNYIFPEDFNVASGLKNTIALKLFETVYPKAISFQFDGNFKGPALVDCTKIINSLAKRLISEDHIRDIPERRTVNRIKNLLINDWKVLNDDFNLNPVPGHPGLKKIINELEEKLKDKKELDLKKDIYDFLTSPPYGFNLISATIVMAIFLGQENPMKIILMDNKEISVDIWLGNLLPKNQISENIISRTKIVFIPTDAKNKWAELLSSWEKEENYFKIQSYYLQSIELKKAIPIPPESRDKYDLLIERYGNSVQSSIMDYEKNLEYWPEDIEKYVKERNIEKLLFLTVKAQRYFNHLEDESEKWEAEKIEVIKEIYEKCKQFISKNYLTWLKEQSWTNPAKTGDYRVLLIDRVSSDLSKLGFSEFKNKTKDHYDKICQEQKDRQKIDSFSESITVFLKTSVPSKSTSRIKLREWLKEISNYRDLWEIFNKSTPKLANAPDIISKKENLSNLESQIKKISNEQDQRLNDLLSKEMMSIQDIEDALLEIKVLKEVFNDDVKNQNDIELTRKQLEILNNDMSAWKNLTGSASELKKRIKQNIEERLVSLEVSGDLDDFCLPTEEIYNSFLDDLISDTENKANEWMKNSFPSLENIDQWNISDCRREFAKLNNIPDFLDTENIKKIEDCRAKINSRRIEIEIESDSKEIIERIKKLPAKEIKNIINNLSEYINDKDISQFNEIKV